MERLTDGLIKIKVKDDLTGRVFGNLTVIERGPDLIQGGKRRAAWYCECSCGYPDKLLISGDSLKSGSTKSCGCIHRNNYAENNIYDLTGDHGICRMKDGHEFIFDLEDYDKIKRYTWHSSTRGYIITTRYIRGIKKHQGMMLHRYLMGVEDIDWKECVVDHINGDIRDNRKSNLRVVSQSQNGMNSKISINNTSGVCGVNRMNGRWAASITVNFEKIFLGIYDDFDDAVNARIEAEEKYFGEYSYKNSRKNNVEEVV